MRLMLGGVKTQKTPFLSKTCIQTTFPRNTCVLYSLHFSVLRVSRQGPPHNSRWKQHAVDTDRITGCYGKCGNNMSYYRRRFVLFFAKLVTKLNPEGLRWERIKHKKVFYALKITCVRFILIFPNYAEKKRFNNHIYGEPRCMYATVSACMFLHVRLNLASINLDVLLKSRFPRLKKAKRDSLRHAQCRSKDTWENETHNSRQFQHNKAHHIYPSRTIHFPHYERERPNGGDVSRWMR